MNNSLFIITNDLWNEFKTHKKANMILDNGYKLIVTFNFGQLKIQYIKDNNSIERSFILVNSDVVNILSLYNSILELLMNNTLVNYKQAYNEIESLWKYGKQELEEYGENEQLFIPETVEALEVAKTVLGSIEQIIWEKDLAISQLRELGYGLGEKIKK